MLCGSAPINLYFVCTKSQNTSTSSGGLIGLIAQRLPVTLSIIEKVTKTINDTSDRIETVFKTFTKNSMEYIFKQKYGAMIKNCKRLFDQLKSAKEE